MKHEQFCQSCSVPLSENLLGTEIDGSNSKEYCKFCYQDGNFTHPHYSLEEMIAHLQNQMDNDCIPEDIIEAAVARLRHLKRWRQQVPSDKD
ncbi:MAG: hypothetical protein EOO02_16085 [Chitinophagaceae bacterium]|nr:MAG: hypothetical protein EOO02_16085 [Chitinophagaceae bacterium]